MTAILESCATAVGRASWQAAVLAALVAAIVWACGERLRPRWRFLLWGVVLVRLVLPATPTARWSVFHVAGSAPAAARVSQIDAAMRADADSAWVSVGPNGGTDASTGLPPVVDAAAPQAVVEHPRSTAGAAAAPAIVDEHGADVATRKWIQAALLAWIWLVGVAVMATRLVLAAGALRRQLSACREVCDVAVGEALATLATRIGLRRPPVVVVSPAAISPCLVGVWRPRIVLPESLLTDATPARLRHVLAHEAAHLVRGDLWTNWLMLVARAVHWFNPAAWLVVRAMQAEREAACDELALAALGEPARREYAETIFALSARLAPSPLAPGLVGLFGSTARLRRRVERLATQRAATRWTSAAGVAVVTLVCAAGLTDAKPQAADDAVAAAEPEEADTSYSISGRVLNFDDQSPIPGARLRLFVAEGQVRAPEELARTVSDAEGRYEFRDLAPPVEYARTAMRTYVVVAEVPGRPTMMQLSLMQAIPGGDVPWTIRVMRSMSTVAGRVIDDEGQPVAGALVSKNWLAGGRAIPGVLSAFTDANGRFEIPNVPLRPDGAAWGALVNVSHPDYATKMVDLPEGMAEPFVALTTGCVVTGQVNDTVSGGPAEGAEVMFVPAGDPGADSAGGEFVAETDAFGKFRIILPAGRYRVLGDATDRVCVSPKPIECQLGEKIELAPLELIEGGFIEGQVTNMLTGEAVAVTDDGLPITIGLFGPGEPLGEVVRQYPAATVTPAGRYRLRAAPGANYPYFVNTRGDRMAWDTSRQPALMVEAGKTIQYNMTVTPEVPAADKLAAARKLVAALPAEPEPRVEKILEMLAPIRTVDNQELWCSLMRELIAVGPAAVPRLSQELDAADEQFMLRRLGFALRAIGDVRAVPALIRAIPKTLQPPMSDYGQIIEDAELMAFMQEHDLDERNRDKYFSFGRPFREIFGALHNLTGQNFNDMELNFMHRLDEGTRGRVMQERLYRQKAEQWAAWWNEHGREFTDDPAYQTVTLPPDRAAELPRGAANRPLKLEEHSDGSHLSPPAEQGQFSMPFEDLETGYHPTWPDDVPRDEGEIDFEKLEAWATENGVDLMCVTHGEGDAKTYVLRTLGAKAWQLSARDRSGLAEALQTGQLPTPREVGNVLLPVNDEGEPAPATNASFLIETREGGLYVIDVTDRVTRTADITGMLETPPGVGFYLGVRYEVQAIVP